MNTSQIAETLKDNWWPLIKLAFWGSSTAVSATVVYRAINFRKETVNRPSVVTSDTNLATAFFFRSYEMSSALPWIILADLTIVGAGSFFIFSGYKTIRTIW